jgi:hypothetical protein
MFQELSDISFSQEYRSCVNRFQQRGDYHCTDDHGYIIQEKAEECDNPGKES